MSEKYAPILPPPLPVPPPELGAAASTVNPFMVDVGTEIIPDDYAAMPPAIATVMRDTDRMSRRIEDACDLDDVKNDAVKLSSLGRTYLHLQRTKLAALATLVKTSESVAAQQLMRAQTVQVEQQNNLTASGITPDVQKYLCDVIARRVQPVVEQS